MNKFENYLINLIQLNNKNPKPIDSPKSTKIHILDQKLKKLKRHKIQTYQSLLYNLKKINYKIENRKYNITF